MFNFFKKAKERVEMFLMQVMFKRDEVAKDLNRDVLPENASKFERMMDKATLVGLSSVGFGTVANVQTVYAIENIKTKSKNALVEGYNFVDFLITVGLCFVLAIGFLVKMFTKNDRAAEAWTMWQKRAVFCWLGFKLIGLFVQYGNELTSDQDKTPWE